jgi:hypothetical protein
MKVPSKSRWNTLLQTPWQPTPTVVEPQGAQSSAPSSNTFTLSLQPPTMKIKYRYLYGIDMSLTNPGMTVMDLYLKTLHLYFFRNHVSETNGQTLVTATESPFAGWLLQWTCIELMETLRKTTTKKRKRGAIETKIGVEVPPSKRKTTRKTAPVIEVLDSKDSTESTQEEEDLTSLYRFARYRYKLDRLLPLIGSNNQGDKVVGVEGYALQAGSGNKNANKFCRTKLQPSTICLTELGGCLRMLLCGLNHEMLEIPPTTIKKMFADMGLATKDQMYQAYLKTFHLPDLCLLLNLKPYEKYKHIPHPVEDLVDSLGVALTLLHVLCS